ncbi:MAG: amphi-Trp domain-containing protein [Gammaproteobacteria bacterium]|nr:amphi-Trp domain-containing protein [Gammaproteobacteria bacterium]
MREDNKTFSHISMQDNESLKEILESIAKSIKKGKMVFSDDEDEIILHPEKLIRFKLKASKSDTKHQVNLKISWDVDSVKIQKSDTLKIQN